LASRRRTPESLSGASGGAHPYSRRAVYHVIATRVVRLTRPSPRILGANLHNFNQNLLRTSSSSRAHTPQGKLAKNDNEMGPIPIFQQPARNDATSNLKFHSAQPHLWCFRTALTHFPFLYALILSH
jgi:hypothetical protein